ncbi:Fc.00g036340.m01.CDS01 [Cosmosporella sp. VM-42]
MARTRRFSRQRNPVAAGQPPPTGNRDLSFSAINESGRGIASSFDNGTDITPRASGSKIHGATEDRKGQEDRSRAPKPDKELGPPRNGATTYLAQSREGDVNTVLEETERMSDLDLRLDGWVQEQVDAVSSTEGLRSSPPTRSLFAGRQTREEIRVVHRAWEASGISKEEQAQLALKFGHHHTLDPGAEVIVPERIGERPPKTPLRRQPNEASRRVRVRRVSNNPVPPEPEMLIGVQTRASASTPSRPQPMNQGRKRTRNDLLEEIGYGTAQPLPQSPTRPRKVYVKSRESRRLSGDSPEFGLLPEQVQEVPIPDKEYPVSEPPPRVKWKASRARTMSKHMSPVKATTSGIVTRKRDRSQ